jgi:exonuclease SbcC
MAKETENARSAALKDVAPFGIGQIPSTALDDIIKDLAKRKGTWQAKLDDKTAHEKKVSDLKAGIDKDNALLSSLEKDLTARRNEREGRLREYEALRASRQEVFGEKNADQEEKRLADAMNKADKAIEKARDEYGQIEKEISALKEKIDLLKVKIGNRATELAQAEQSLKEQRGRIQR